MEKAVQAVVLLGVLPYMISNLQHIICTDGDDKKENILIIDPRMHMIT